MSVSDLDPTATVRQLVLLIMDAPSKYGAIPMHHIEAVLRGAKDHPDLLVDLAIEAGGLEQAECEECEGCGREADVQLADGSWWCMPCRDEADDGLEAVTSWWGTVYRRTPTEANDDR